VFKRYLQVAWLVTLGALVFGGFHAVVRDPLQSPSAMLFGFCGVVASLSTVVYWVVIVPLAQRTGERTRRIR
jgi:hypothetical protein